MNEEGNTIMTKKWLVCGTGLTLAVAVFLISFGFPDTLMLKNWNQWNTSQYIGIVFSALLIAGSLYSLWHNKKSGPVYAAADNTITFRDVAGNEHAIRSLQTIVEYIKNPQRFSAMGARMPAGILFYGPPGTGKTLMARALANEAGVPFLHANGADFVQMYVGVGAARIRSLFKKAKSHGRAVIFIDEIDALGRSRKQQTDNSERDQTLNALLGEMSGFSANNGILVVAATNRREMLDEALLRPGRFDRQLYIGLPDRLAREQILDLLLSTHPVSECDPAVWAKRTPGFSGAALECMVNEAAILAAQENRMHIHAEHLEKAWRTTVSGEEATALEGRDRKIVAYHEAGHAVISRLLLPNDKIDHITILPSTRGSGGHMLRIPDERMQIRSEMYAGIQMLLGGRAAEELIFGEESISAGASNDIERASQMLEEMLFRLGMDEQIGPIRLRSEDQKLSSRMSFLYDDTLSLLREHESLLRKVAARLMEKDTLSGDELELLCRSDRDETE